MGTLKNEMLQGGSFASEIDARIKIFDFIQSYYNHHHKHSALNNKIQSNSRPKSNPTINQILVQKSVAPQLEISQVGGHRMERVAYFTEFFPASALAKHRMLMVDRDSAPRRARRWCVQFDVGELSPIQ